MKCLIHADNDNGGKTLLTLRDDIACAHHDEALVRKVAHLVATKYNPVKGADAVDLGDGNWAVCVQKVKSKKPWWLWFNRQSRYTKKRGMSLEAAGRRALGL